MSEYAPRLWDKLCTTPLSDVLRGHLSQSLDWHGAVEREGLPPRLAELVVEVVRRARLWKGERVAIAQELAAHFRDGLEAGATAEGLAESFGDPRTAAQLVRRAKRRCRPLWWQGWWYASRTFAGLLALYIAAAVWLAFERPVVSVNYLEVFNREAAAVAEEDRAWPLYFEALKIVAEEQAAKREANPNSDVGRFDAWAPDWMQADPWTPKQAARAADWVDSHRAFLDKLIEAAAKPGLGADVGAGSAALRDFAQLDPSYAAIAKEDPQEQWLSSVLLPHTQQLGSVVRALKADARVALARDDSGRTARAIHAMLGVSRHAGETPILVCASVEQSLVRSAIDEVHRVLAEKPALWSDSQLRDLAHDVARQERPLAYYLDGERVSLLDLVQRVYSPRGVLTPDGVRELAAWGFNDWFLQVPPAGAGFDEAAWALSPAVSFTSATVGETRDAINRFIELAIADSLAPLASATRAEEFARSLSRRYAILDNVWPATNIARNAFERSAGERDGVLLGIALELYRRDRGDWPKALDNLVPRFMPQLTTDRIHRGPLGYRVVEGKPVVYSLGWDKDDDEGRLPARTRPNPDYASPPKYWTYGGDNDGDWVIWSLGEPRYVGVEE